MKEGLMKIIALGIMCIPLFISIFIPRMLGSAFGKIAGFVNNPNKGPFDKLHKANQERVGRMRDNREEGALKDFAKKSNPNIFQRMGAGGRATRKARNTYLAGAAKQNLDHARQKQIGDALKHDPNFAQAAAGGKKASPDDITRAIAQGISSLNEIEAKNLKASQTVLADAKLDGPAMMGLVSGAAQRGADGRTIEATQSMRMAAIATLAAQGRQTEVVAEHVVASGNEELQKFFVGQVQANYNAVKARNGAMVDETFLKDISEGRVTTKNFNDNKVAAAGRGATRLNVETMASQDEAFLKDLQTYMTAASTTGLSDPDKAVIDVAKAVKSSNARVKTTGVTAPLLETIGSIT